MDQIGQFVSLTPAQFSAILAVIVPGFLSLKIQQALEAKAGAAGVEAFVEIIGFALFNAFVMSWPIDVIRQQMASGAPNFAIVAPNSVLICVIGPVLWPILLFVGKRELLRGAWLWGEQKTAFDAFFSTGQPCWMIVHMTDGRSVAGYFGGHSYAGAHPQTGDLYLEQLWSVDAEGGWVGPLPDSKGALFRSIDTLWLEFFWDKPAPGDKPDAQMRPIDPHIRKSNDGYVPRPGARLPPGRTAQSGTPL